MNSSKYSQIHSFCLPYNENEQIRHRSLTGHIITQGGELVNNKVSLALSSLFLAGAQGLEPWAYGFGDEADKSASGGTTFEVLISTIQEQTAAVFLQTESKS